uniref:Uncharacterized protein n=1 Tax=Planktothrix agardhii TaxID=1160 RepID=A0A1J1J936_PLAAG|nr:protein of unknown function [Planktothrix agardhii]
MELGISAATIRHTSTCKNNNHSQLYTEKQDVRNLIKAALEDPMQQLCVETLLRHKYLNSVSQ